MSLITTNKNALKLLRIDGSTININDLSNHHLHNHQDINTETNVQIRPDTNFIKNCKTNSKNTKSKVPASQTSKIAVIINSNPSKHNFDFESSTLRNCNDQDNIRISAFIRKIAEEQSTPEYSSDSQNDQDEDLFLDDEDSNHTINNANGTETGNKLKQGKKWNVSDGIELMLHQLQQEAKLIEQKRYFRHTNHVNNNTLITNSIPKDIVNLTQKRGSYKVNERRSCKDNMNWWDMPFKDYLRSSKRPIIRETGIDQFASEYMLSLLRDKEQKVLKLRQEIEYKRTRPPINNWYEMKGKHFGSELRRHNRHNRK